MAIKVPFDPNDFNAVPLPKGLPSIDLPKISIAKLLEGDAEEAKRVYDISTRTGFFYLNLMDHPTGRKLWENACIARNIGQKVMSSLTMEEKDSFLRRPEVGILDRGFQSTIRDEKGQTRFVESINIPRDELFAKEPTGWKLPEWLQEYEGAFREVQRDAHTVNQIVLGILEKELQLAPGELTDCHVLDEPTHSFLRILRYPGARHGDKPFDRPRFFAHRDIVSVAMLFTWVCGLQIPKENPDMVDDETETEESWRWVAPEAGYAIVNLGDTMPIFTNGALASGRHRVVSSYGDQASLDRVCVLLSSRPTWETPMKPFVSPVIPPQTKEQAAQPIESCKVWGDNCVKVFIEENVKGGKR